MKTYGIKLYFENNLELLTKEVSDAPSAEELEGDLREMMQNMDTGPWKTIGNVNFVWKRLVAFKVEEYYSNNPKGN